MLTRPGETGFRIDAGTSDQVVHHMAKAMVKLAQNASLRERLGKAAREIVASCYLWNENKNLFCEYYAKCIQNFENASTEFYSEQAFRGTCQ